MRGHGYSQIHIFAEQRAGDFLEQTKNSIRLAVENEADEYLLNVNEETYLDHMVDRFTIDPLEIHTDKVYASTHEAEIASELFPRDFYIRDGTSYKKDVINYHIPFTGNPELLRYIPNPRIMWSIPVTIKDSEIIFEIINFRNDPEQIKREADENIKKIMTNYGHLNSQIASFNNSVREEAKRAFRGRKEHLLKKNNLLSSLGVPIKKKAGVPETFAIPAKEGQA